MDSDHSQDTKDWPRASIDLEKLKDSFLLLKQKMCKTHELIQRYNDKLKECECLKTERDALKKEAKKMTYNYNTALAKIIKLEHQNAEYKKNNEKLSKTVNDFEIKISSDQQLVKQLTCKLNDLEDKHSDKIMVLDLEKSCLSEKVKELEQELKTLKKSGMVKLKKSEKKSNDVENDCADLSTMKKVMQDVAINTDTETYLQTAKQETCDKCIMTDEFYSIKDDPYPIFCAKCETFLNPPPIDKICAVMTECPPLLDNILSPAKKHSTASNDVPDVRFINEEEVPVAEIKTHYLEEIPEDNTLTANSQSSSTLMIKTLERKVNALESKLKKESRRRSTSLRNCCPNAHHYCNNFNGKNTFDVPIYPSIMSEFCKTLMDINKENKKRKNSNKRSCRNVNGLRKFTLKKVKLKNKKAVKKKTANPWSVEPILKNGVETDSPVGAKWRKLKRKKLSKTVENSDPSKFNELFTNEVQPSSISSDVADNIKVDNDTDDDGEDAEEQNDVRKDSGSNLNKSMNDLKKCNNEQNNTANEEITIIETLSLAGTYENVNTVADDDGDDGDNDNEKYRVSDTNGTSLQSAKEVVETLVTPLSIEEGYSGNRYHEYNMEININEREDQDEKTCDHLSNEMDDYLCSLCGKLVKCDNYSNVCKTDIVDKRINDSTDALHDDPAISNYDENVTNMCKLSHENAIRNDNVTDDGEERFQQKELLYTCSTSVVDHLEDTTKLISTYELNDERTCMTENPQCQFPDVLNSNENMRNVCNLCLNELIDDSCPSCDIEIKSEKLEEETVACPAECEAAPNDGVRDSIGQMINESEKETLEVKVPNNEKELQVLCTFRKDNLAGPHCSDNRLNDSLNSISTSVSERNLRKPDETDTGASSDLPQQFGKEQTSDEKTPYTLNHGEPDEIAQTRKRKRGRPPKLKDTSDRDNLMKTLDASKDVHPISVSQTENLNGKDAQETAGETAGDVEEKITTTKKRPGRPAKSKTGSNRVNLMKKLRLLKKNKCAVDTSCSTTQDDVEADACEPTKKRRVAHSTGMSSILSSTLPCVEKSPDVEDKPVLNSRRRSCRIVLKKLETMVVNLPDKVGNMEEGVPDDDDSPKRTEVVEEYAKCCTESSREARSNGTMTNNALDELLPPVSLKTCETVNDFDMECQKQPGLDCTKKVMEVRKVGEPCLSADNDVSPLIVTPEKAHFEDSSRSSLNTPSVLKDSNFAPVQRTHFIPIRNIGLLTQPKSKVSVKRDVVNQEKEGESRQLNESRSVVNSIDRVVGTTLGNSTLVSTEKSYACSDIRKSELSVESIPAETSNTDWTVQRDDIGIIPTSPNTFDSSILNMNELPVTPMSPENSDTETLAHHDDVTIIPTTPESIDLTAKHRMSATSSETDIGMSANADQLVATPMSPEKSNAEAIARPNVMRIIPTSPKHACADDEAVDQSPLTLFKNMCANYRRKNKRKRNRESTERVHEATDAFVRKQLRRILDSSEWSPAVHRDIVAKLSDNCSDRIIAKGIVEAVMDESYNKVLDKQYTPPAPPMTKAQQKYLSLLLELSSLKPSVFHYVEQGILYKLFRLNSAPKWPEMERLIRMYVVMARVQKNREKVRIFCLDALYCLGHSISPVFQIVLTSWPEVLPICGASSEIIPKVIVHLLMTQTGKDVVFLKKMLMKYYQYPPVGYSTKNLLQEMLGALESGQCNGLDTGLILLAKHVGVSWTYENIIRDGLLQTIVANKHPNVYRAFCLLGNLMRPFPLNDPDGIVGKIVEQLVDLLESGEGSAEQQEGVASALISLSRHKPNETMKTVLNWRPLKHLTPRTMKQLEMTFYSQTPESWKAFIKKNERSKKELC